MRRLKYRVERRLSMIKQRHFFWVLLLFFLILSSASEAYTVVTSTRHYPTWGYRMKRFSGPYFTVHVRGIPYYYHTGVFYRPYQNSYVVVEPPMGAVVTVLPDSCRREVYGGLVHYVYNDVYYRPVDGGYMVVERPVTPTAPVPPTVVPAAPVITQPSDSSEVYTVNIPMKQGGGFVPVLIKRFGTGFLGPQGEFYTEFPSVKQLQLMYVK